MMKKKDVLFSGAASEIVTPFTRSGDVDFPALFDEVSFMLENGVTGIFMNGLASEALMMSAKDRLVEAEEILSRVNGAVPVMGNVIANSISEGIDFAREYEAMGVDAITITPPILYHYTNEGLYEYFDTVAKTVHLPVYIYNAPETGNKLSPALVAKLFSQNEAFYGYKDSTQNIIEQQTLLAAMDSERHFELLAGSDAQIVTTMMLGGVGVISLITVVFPKLIVDTVKACEQKDWKEAVRLQAKVLKVREALKTGPFMAAYKFVSKCMGRPMGYMKRPLVELNKEQEDKILILLKELKPF